MTRWQALVPCYHAVSEEWPHALSIDLATLERQLASFLRRGFRPAAVADLLGRSGRLLHITFDDAFRSVERALPALERLGLPATVFACSGIADTGAPLAVKELAPELANHPEQLATMGWDALRGLGERGIEIGSHTVSHPHLPLLSDAELQRELRESRDRIADELSRPCRYLAYPFGDEDARVRAAAAAAGYDASFALASSDHPVDRFALPRIGIYRADGNLRLRIKVAAASHRSLRLLLP